MKRIILSFALIAMGIMASNSQTVNKVTPVAASTKIEAYYFHFNARCETCRAVESEAKTDIETLYPGIASFKAINLDDAASKTIAEKLKISGQTLLIVKGDQKINLTNEGFMYATTNPAKLRTIIKQKVDHLLEK